MLRNTRSMLGVPSALHSVWRYKSGVAVVHAFLKFLLFGASLGCTQKCQALDSSSGIGLSCYYMTLRYALRRSIVLAAATIPPSFTTTSPALRLKVFARVIHASSMAFGSVLVRPHQVR